MQGTVIPDEVLVKVKQEAPAYIRKHQLKTLSGVARHFGISRTKFWQMRKQDPNFELAVNEAMEDRDSDTAERIESSWKRRLLKGKVSAAEVLFYLTNAMPDKYKDRRALIGSIKVGASASAGVSRLQEISDDDLAAATKAIIMRDNLPA